MDLDVKEYNLK